MKRILVSACTEGNGHLTQALALKEHLNHEDYEIVGAVVADKKRGIPRYFKDEFNLFTYSGFNFIFDSVGRVVLWKTLLHNTVKLPVILYSLIKILYHIKVTKPDIIVNFYDPLIGLSSLINWQIKYISISHQFCMTESKYPEIEGFKIQKMFVKILNWVTSLRSEKIGLSYYDIPDSKIIISPPLLRKEAYIRSADHEDFILCYLINQGMLRDLFCEARKYPDTQVECFTVLTKEPINVPDNVKLFNVDAKLFQQRMKVCSGVICTGGFETSSEAINLCKPLLMVPLPNHYEQYANSNDAEQAGYAKFSPNIDFSKIPNNQIKPNGWFNKTMERLNLDI